ncbi:MAG: type II toxin-antitoxin system RelE/ParE family toxin [Gemmataceae bacterium]|nr:type II toxin-antitoxin system RelE/ParE family toxin [Gemmataceae bacterium]
MTDVVLSAHAELEYEDAYDWYHRRSPRAAARFERAAHVAIRMIADAPEAFPFYEEPFRYRPLKRFPYLLVYRIRANDVQIVAVAHASRRPGYWKNRES